MGRKIDKITGETKYYIPVDGKYYETSAEIYKAYFKMERRERYLEERSRLHDVSYEKLTEDGFPVEENLHDSVVGIEDKAMTTIMIEKMLSRLFVLNDYEMWLINEVYSHCKSDRQIESESNIPRRSIAYHKKKILAKLRTEIENA